MSRDVSPAITKADPEGLYGRFNRRDSALPGPAAFLASRGVAEVE